MNTEQKLEHYQRELRWNAAQLRKLGFFVKVQIKTKRDASALAREGIFGSSDPNTAQPRKRRRKPRS